MLRPLIIPGLIVIGVTLLVPQTIASGSAGLSGTGGSTGEFVDALGAGTPPVADAGSDYIAPVAMEGMAHANLDGTGSTDPDGSIVSYSWKEGTTVLSTAMKEEVMLMMGVHDITLTVTDDTGMTDTDEVQITIMEGPADPSPFFCSDVNGDGAVSSGDLGMIASVFGKRFGQPGYSRMVDPTMDRVVSSGDLGVTASFFGPCSEEDMLIREATVAIEPYQNINAAFAAGYVSTTQFVPAQGRHLVKFSLLDTTFDPAQPEGLLYEPDPSTPGGWRLGGAFFDIPYQQYPYVPDGFPGTENERWHYHDYLCFYSDGNGGTYVTLDNQTTCQSNGGTYQEKVGWLLHLWTYVAVPNGDGIYVGDNMNFMGLP